MRMMRLLSLHSLSILAASILNVPIASAHEQQVLNLETAMAENGAAAIKIGVPGHNDAFYGPVPKKDQIFVIDFLEIAPSPIPVDKVFFVLLRGEIPSSHAGDITADQLAAAKLNITMSLTHPEGDNENEDKSLYTIPLRTAELADEAHLAIRDSQGRHVDSLTAPGTGRNDILTDYWIPGMFVETGKYKFEIVAELEDGRCLFAIWVEQWLEGSLRRW
ncbi:hypothetical protein QBC37DRAFT_55930 [Rhypophila decipiens]|uniref:Uncharacterized protein n=1 Tax=Rhypophila decipiens TaxID=261697 RepID=A0AAN7B382_9PEZI|nr:hypothetical protein QBC37DRAFT_55930 [Rhypophila decipiens]